MAGSDDLERVWRGKVLDELINIADNTIPGGGGLTDAELRASPVPVSVNNFPVSQPVTGVFFQATQPVSGTFFQATQPVSGTFWQATQPVSGPVTDVQMRAVPIPISGTVTVNVGLTDAQLRAVPVPVSGTFFQATQPVSGTFWQATQPVSGTFFQATQPVSAVSLPLPSGAATEVTLGLVATQATLALIKAKTDNLDVALSTRAVTGITDVQIRATPLPVSGTVAVTGTFWQATQPVSGTFWQATQPVSGTFWQATQPVSAVSLPLPLGAATEATLGLVATQATLALIKAKTDNLDVALSTRAVTGITDAQIRATPLPVSGTVAVTGTFWQATQPVSGTFWQATQPVSGTFWPTTAAAPLSGRLSDGAAFYDAAKTGQLPTALVGARLDCNTGAWLGSTAPTVGQKTMANAVPVSIASDQATFPVTATGPTLTKGTQGATGFSVQDLKDAGRVLKTYTCTAIAAVTSEALITLTPYADLVAGGGATTFPVTSAKRLRIQSIMVTVRCTSTVNVGGIIRFRLLAGTVLVGSPIHATLGCQGSNLATAVIGNSKSYQLTFPDGLELSGTMQFGLTQLFSATTATIDVQIVAYEY